MVVHTIGLPVFVTPRAPCLEQNAPGYTVGTDAGFGFAVVGFGFGLLIVGLATGRGGGLLLVRCGAGVGLSAEAGVGDASALGVGLTPAVALSTRRSPATGAVAVAAATGFLSPLSSVSAPMAPTPQHSRTEIAAAIPMAPAFPIFFLPE